MTLKLCARNIFPSLLMLAALSVSAEAAAPSATSFTTTASTVGSTMIQLQGADADGTALTFAIASGPASGTLSGLNASTGTVVYNPAAGFTGTTTFTFTVASGGDTTAAATVTVTVTNAKTRITDTVLNADGTPRQGKVTFILTQPVTSPGGLVPAASTVSGTLGSTGQFTVSVYPSRSLSPQTYYQVWYEAAGGLSREMLGIYDIPASTATISLSGYKVTDTNLATRYTFASLAQIESLIGAVAGAAIADLLAGTHTTGKYQRWSDTGFVDSLTSESGGTVTVGGNLTVTGTITGAVATTLDNLSDVTSAGATPGQFLRRGASQWESAMLASSDIPNLGTDKIVSGQFPNARTSATSSNTAGAIVARDESGNFNAGTINATAFVGNGAGLTGLGVGTSTGHSATGSVSVVADNDDDGSGIIDLMSGPETGARLNNDKTFEVFGGLKLSGSSVTGTPTFTTWAATSAQTFNQIDQPSGTTVASTAAHLFSRSVNSTGHEFGLASRVYAPSKTSGSVAALLGESRTTDGPSAGSASSHEVIGVNGVADCNQTHTGPCRGIEANVNKGANTRAAAGTYATHLSATDFSSLFFAGSGGVSRPDAGFYAVGVSAANAPVRTFFAPKNATTFGFSLRGFEAGAGVDPTLPGYVALGFVAGDSGIVGQRGSDTGAGLTGDFLRLRNSANTADVFKVDMTGIITASAAKFIANTDGLQIWKDATPSKAYSFGLSIPGSALTDVFTFSYFNGTSWAGAFTYNGADKNLGVTGSVQLSDGGTKPTCDATQRFRIWTDASGAGVKDTVEICAKAADNTYAWRTLY